MKITIISPILLASNSFFSNFFSMSLLLSTIKENRCLNPEVKKNPNAKDKSSIEKYFLIVFLTNNFGI